MSIADDIIAAIEAETTVISSVITYIQSLLNGGVITQDVATSIIEHINSDRERLQDAIVANTPNG